MPIYTHDQYYSFHQREDSFPYSDLSGSARVSVRTGFKNKHDLDDPIVRCQREGGTCAYQTLYAFGGEPVTTNLNRFRIFVPPGTKDITLTVMLTQPSSFVVIARMGKPIEKNYSGTFYSYTDKDLLALPTKGFKVSQLIAADCIGRNSSGFLNIMRDVNAAGFSSGGWVYVQTYSQQGGTTNGILSTVVLSQPYLSWFRSAGWDAVGDPLASGFSGGGDPQGGVSPLRLDFGTVPINTPSSPLSIDVSNITSQPTPVAIVYPNGFSGDWAGSDLAVGTSRPVHVVFTPTEDRAYTGSIKITVGTQTFSVAVTGSTLAAETPETELQKLIEELSQKLAAAGQAEKSLDQMIEKLEASQACVTAAASNPAITAVPAAAAVVDFHLNKTSGSYGSYGIAAQLSRLNSMKAAIVQEISFYELAISVYNRLDKGLDIPSDLVFPPGYDQDAGTLYNKDMDHPASRSRLGSGADLHLQNRPYDINLDGYILPSSSSIGDMICLDGIQHIFAPHPVAGTNIYYPVGIQETEETCIDYGLCHAECTPEGGGQ